MDGAGDGDMEKNGNFKKGGEPCIGITHGFTLEVGVLAEVLDGVEAGEVDGVEAGAEVSAAGSGSIPISPAIPTTADILPTAIITSHPTPLTFPT